MSVILTLCSKRAHTIHVEDRLRAPVNSALRHGVYSLLRRGENQIVLDLSAVQRIDAGGLGELIRAFNMTAGVNGVLRIANAPRRVRAMLERAHVFDVLSGDREVERRLA